MLGRQTWAKDCAALGGQVGKPGPFVHSAPSFAKICIPPSAEGNQDRATDSSTPNPCFHP
jgi:hypothetical protein